MNTGIKRMSRRRIQITSVTDSKIDNYCPHCYPSKNNHAQNKIDSLFSYFFEHAFGKISSILPKKYFQFIGESIQRIVIDFSQLIKHSELTDNIDRAQLNNNILVIWDEAKSRGLKIFNVKFDARHTQYFVVIRNGKKYYFDRSPIYLIAQKIRYFDDAKKYDDKAFLKKTLLHHNIPCPIGREFISSKKALDYGIKLKFPLVVKPAMFSLSRHVSFNIKSKEELKDAIAIAKQANYRVVVEQYITGDVYRIILIDKVVVACAKRQASSVIGNGITTIEKLIDEKNNHPWRGDPERRDCTLHKVEKNFHLEKILEKQGINLKTKLKKGRQIFLSNKMNNSNAADVTNVTDLIHSENEKLFLKIHGILNLPLTGLDFICQDVSIPWQMQQFAIIENNSLPYIDIHHYPSAGDPINVASKIWDFVLELLNKC